GIAPEQVIDFQTMVGDGVDNVPGVPGIGPKTATALLQQFGSLAGVLANVDKVSGAKRQENIKASAGKLPITRQLVTLKTEVPIALDGDGGRVQEPEVTRCLALFQQWGFRGIGEQVKKLAAAGVPALAGAEPEPPKGGTPTPVQRELFSEEETFPFGANTSEPEASAPGSEDLALTLPARTSEWKANYHLIDTAGGVKKFHKNPAREKRLALDLEANRPDPLR